LESFIYDAQDKLDQDLVLQFSTEEERETLRNKLAEAGDWLYDNPNAKLSDYTEKKNEVINDVDVIFNRVREYLYKLMEEQRLKEEAERQALEAAKKAEEEAIKKAEEEANRAAGGETGSGETTAQEGNTVEQSGNNDKTEETKTEDTQENNKADL